MTTLEQFDDLFTGNPSDIENNLSALLSEAKALENNSIYVQILSQIALAQAMQQKFDQAHNTLDVAEANLRAGDTIAHARILLERGRVFHQSGDVNSALPLFKQSYKLCDSCHLDVHTINAAHMVAILENSIEDKVHWNKVAIALAETSDTQKASEWLSALYSNLAQNYLEEGNYSESLDAFERSKKHAELKGHSIVARGAKWGIARNYRSLGRLEEALTIQNNLLNEYEDMSKKKELPIEIIYVGRGMVYEELAELHRVYVKHYATLAYDDLSKDAWCCKLIPERVNRMKGYAENEK